MTIDASRELDIARIGLAPGAATASPARRRPVGRAVQAFLHDPMGVAGVAVLAIVVLTGLLAPVLYPFDPLSIVGPPLLWPGQDLHHLLGTDSLGRDVSAGMVHGAGVSLLIGLSATAVGLVVGVTLGAAAGYFGGWIDDVLVRFVELFQTIPSFVLLVVVMAIAKPTVQVVTLAIGLVSWPAVARLARAEFRTLRERDFVLAARSLGYGHLRIIVSEILPNALPPIIVSGSVMVASAILMESALSFMGLGDPNRVTWGAMIGTGREFLRTAWYLTALPGLAIVATVLALNLVGDGLNAALNPRTEPARR